MWNVIAFLERAGADADLKGAADDVLEMALDGVVVDAATKAALLRADRRALEAVLDLKSSICCGLVRPEPGEEDDEEEPGKEDEVRAAVTSIRAA